jgi:hypothetical protein
MIKATDEMTLICLKKLNRIKRFEERYIRLCQDKKKVEAGMVQADWFKVKLPNLKFEKKVLARLNDSFIETKKKLREYEKANGLEPVILDFFGGHYGFRDIL